MAALLMSLLFSFEFWWNSFKLMLGSDSMELMNWTFSSSSNENCLIIIGLLSGDYYIPFKSCYWFRFGNLGVIDSGYPSLTFLLANPIICIAFLHRSEPLPKGDLSILFSLYSSKGLAFFWPMMLKFTAFTGLVTCLFDYPSGDLTEITSLASFSISKPTRVEIESMPSMSSEYEFSLVVNFELFLRNQDFE